jgi:uncharacterized protein (DUF2141 family)
MQTWKLLPILSVFLLMPAIPMAAVAADLNLNVHTFRNTDGDLLVSVYADARGFPDHPEEAARIGKKKITETTESFSFHDLKPGTYAVAVVHDENSNGRLDTGPLGIPTEGFGFSRNPKIEFSAPSFDETKIEVQQGSNNADIQLNYMPGVP